MEDFWNSWGLSLLVFVPLIGAAVMMLVPKEEEALLKQVALVTSVITLVIAVITAWGFEVWDLAYGDLQFVIDKPWIDIIDSRYILGIDGISLPLVLLTALVVPLVIIYSWNHFPEPKDPKAS